MKKIISFIVITLLLIASVTVEQIYLHSSFDGLLNKIEALNTQIEQSENVDTQEIEVFVEDIQQYWEEIENILCMTINYNDLHRIGEQLQRVETYAKRNQKDDCLTELQVLIFYTESYQRIFHINFSNIF